MSGQKVYRVYESFHDPAESGTFEYGVYSTLERATLRMIRVWKDKGYPQPSIGDATDTSMFVYNMGDNYSMYVETIEVDKDISDKNVGYT